MVKFVIKNNGDKVIVDENKTKHSIVAAAKDAGLDDKKASSVADEVTGIVLNFFGEVDAVSTVQIKEKVLAHLDASYPEVSLSWRKHDKEHGK